MEGLRCLGVLRSSFFEGSQKFVYRLSRRFDRSVPVADITKCPRGSEVAVYRPARVLRGV